jgi:putative pyoverdin transport system ATP-binding/permease protein
MKVLSFLFKRSATSVVVITLATIVSGLANAGLVALINIALESPDSRALQGSFVALCVVMVGGRTVAGYFLNRLSSRTLFSLRMDLSRRILATPLRHLEDLGMHRILGAMTDDVTSIITALVQLPILCRNITVVVACLAYLLTLSWKVFLMSTLFLAIGMASYRLPVQKARQYLDRAREEWDLMLGLFRSMTEGIKELKLHRHRRDAFFSQVLEPAGRRFEDINVKGMTMNTAALSWGQTLVFALIGLIVFVVPALTGVPPDTLSAYAVVFLYIIVPLDGIVLSLPVIARANNAMRKIEQLGFSLQGRPIETDGADPRPEKPWSRLELRGVVHNYQGERQGSQFTLGPIDLTFRPGEIVFLVGGNGSGKTTLAKILTGLYSPEAGEIRFDGRALDDQTRDAYRQHFAAVFSDFHLFDKLLGLESTSLDGQAHELLERLQLDGKVEVKDGRLSTTALSQGQRKRLALLTAYLEDRPIYVFDEWAADQDPSFKRVFYRRLLPDLKARGKTVIVISHDDHYYDAGDRLIRLDYGKVEYDGTVDARAQLRTDRPA